MPDEHELVDGDVVLLDVDDVSPAGHKVPNLPLSAGVSLLVDSGGISDSASGCVTSAIDAVVEAGGSVSGSAEGSDFDSVVDGGSFSVVRLGVGGGEFPGVRVAITIVTSSAATSKKVLAMF